MEMMRELTEFEKKLLARQEVVEIRGKVSIQNCYVQSHIKCYVI